MSGGELDYVYLKLECIENKIPDMEIRDLCNDFSKLLHDLEWYLSGDTLEGSWLKSAEDFRKKWLRGEYKDRCKTYIYQTTEEMRNQLMDIAGLTLHCEDCKKFHKEADGNYGQCEEHKGYLDHYYSRACENAEFED